jgi:putative ABC transport system permease protein
MAELKLALRMLMRDWRAGELRILALSLVVAVASVTSVGFFGDRVRQALVRDAHQLLGADMVLVGDYPWNTAIRDEAVKRGLAVADVANFISMTRNGEAAQLTGMRAVSEGFPLRGKLRVTEVLNAPDHETATVPLQGAAWIDERMTQALGLKVGDAVEVGKLKLTVGAIVTLEPDRNASFFNFAPRLMMRIEDLAASGLVTTGSRVRYSLLVAGERETVVAFENWVKPKLERGQRLESLISARPEVGNTLDRAQNFVGLTALLAVILAAVAVSLSTRRYSMRHQDAYAVMRCFGATAPRLFRLAAAEFTMLAVVASVIGCAIGYAAQYIIAAFVAEYVGAKLPPPSMLPAAQGFLIGFVLLLGFALPPLLQLRNVPALRVLRRDVGLPQHGTLLAYGIGADLLAVLLVWQVGDLKLGIVVLGGFGFAFLAFGLLAFVALRAIGKLGQSGAAAVKGGARRGNTWRMTMMGLANLRRHAQNNTVQVLALTMGLIAILLLSFTRDDLLNTWQSSVPPDAPNRFVINIQPEQRGPLLETFAQNGVTAPTIYPMIRGRLTERNGQPINVDDFQDRDRRMAEREFNLSYMALMQSSNELVEGKWFTREDMQSGALSVEQGLAKRVGWKLGDRLTWQIAGENFTAPITSIRKLDWDSMQVNFFVIASPGLFDRAPTSYITSFHLPEDKAALTGVISQRFSNLTVVDMSAIIRQAQGVITQVVKAVQFVFLFALAAGVLVLYAALLSTQHERQQEGALMRALGASRKQILAAQRVEFAVLGLLSGLLAALGATAIGYLIAKVVFQFPYAVNHWVWLAGPVAGLVCVSLNAWAGARAALNHPPLMALRDV